MEDIRMANTNTRGYSKAIKANGTMFIHNYVRTLPYGENISIKF
jgi:hypothetical protein